jgi:hypothetical protein
MPEESLKFVDIIRAFPSAAGVLAVDRINTQSTRTDTENESILSESEHDNEDQGEEYL